MAFDDLFDIDDDWLYGDEDPEYVEWLKKNSVDEHTLRKQFLSQVVYPKMVKKHKDKDKAKSIVKSMFKYFLTAGTFKGFEILEPWRDLRDHLKLFLTHEEHQ